MNLFAFEETAARALPEEWIRQIAQDVFGLEDSAQFSIRPIEMILPTVTTPTVKTRGLLQLQPANRR
jgi:hypothetical protein